MLPAPHSNELVLTQSIDTVVHFLDHWLGIPADTADPYTIQVTISSFQTFTTRETFEEYKKNGTAFYNVYTHDHNVPAKWKIQLVPLDNQQTSVVFTLLGFLADPEHRSYKYAQYYKTQLAQIVSNGNLEGLIDLSARAAFAKAPIISAAFSRSSGYDDGRYHYDHFIPDTVFRGTLTLTDTVPHPMAGAALKNNLLVYGQYSGKLYAFDLQQLTLRWTKQLPFNAGEQNKNYFTVQNHIIYQPSNKGTLSAVDARDGKVYWQCTTNNYKGNSVAYFGQYAPVSGDMVYVNDEQRIYSINRYTGKMIWAQQHGGYGHYNYSFSDKYLYKSGILELFELDKRSGEVHKIINSTQQNTFYFDNLLLGNKLICSDGHLYCYDLQSDSILFQQAADYTFISADTTKKQLYLGSAEGAFSSVDVRKGNTLWAGQIGTDSGSYIRYCSYLHANNKLFVLTELSHQGKPGGYKITVINCANGKIIKELKLAEKPISNMTAHGNQLIFLTAKGICYLDAIQNTLSMKACDLAFISSDDITIGNDNFIAIDN